MSTNLKQDVDSEDNINLDASEIEMCKQAAEEVPVNRKQQDLAFFNAYKKNGTPENFQNLYRSFKPLIAKAVLGNMIGSPIPQSAHMAFAAQSFYDSLRTFDPSKGGLHTHVFTAVKEKGKRLNYKYQNIGYIPEQRLTKYQFYHNAVEVLKQQLGREPSTTEIADEMRWSTAQVEKLREEIKKDLILDEGISQRQAFIGAEPNMQLFYDVHSTLIPQHQVVMEHAVGMFGKPSLVKKSGGADINAISKVTKLSPNLIRSAFKTITRKIKDFKGTYRPIEMEAEEGAE